MGYFDWHDEPGYFRDVTRHFGIEDRILDVGCGTGWIAKHLPNYTGIDGSPDAVERAGQLGRNVSLGDVAEPLPFENASFDGVILKDLLEHVLDPGAVVREALRVLRPGGLAFASSPSAQRWVWDDYTHVRPFTIRGFRRLFVDQGFEVVTSGHESVMPGTSIVSRRTKANRRPLPYRIAARTPLIRRNVWMLARAPTR